MLRTTLSTSRRLCLFSTATASAASPSAAAAAPLTPTSPDASDLDPVIPDLVARIARLNLIQNAQLVRHLKETLSISDIALPAAAAPAPAASGAAAAQAEEEAPAKVEKAAFTIKLEKFEASAKAKMIREIKALIPGSNLVAAKKFVESVPKVIREDVPKEEAMKIKELLEGLGGSVTLE